MGILDYLRRRKEDSAKVENEIEELPKVAINEEEVDKILEEEIQNFFPTKGGWYSSCFEQPKEIAYKNLPCHLRDNKWMSQLLCNVLNDKGIYIPQRTIKNFMDSSEIFDNLRHEHELKIVKWQIDYMSNGGEGWLIPKGFDEFSLLFSEDVDKMFRGGVVKTLSAIGMDGEVIEEGVEEFADMWRPRYMEMGFEHKFQPVYYLKGTPEPYDKEHKENWLADREYQYYQEHKKSVDKYGTKTSAMCMTKEEHSKMVSVLEEQNAQRLEVINQWKDSSTTQSQYKSINLDDVSEGDFVQ